MPTDRANLSGRLGMKERLDRPPHRASSGPGSVGMLIPLGSDCGQSNSIPPPCFLERLMVGLGGEGGVEEVK
ncbi:hypothetical protein ASPCADRAFT_203351 [Aspergillus carbonarius ITEM 5010]|uniref:Uncharacterized protein n=1 Tax=Aspergillus carbonarius (strain ITEM 5010) TaxID=602072 RepID=A0A1R3RYK6_ASPC5|nr:hypothetical protein ASPCADRAFT_203351 [Aspergillus carbonarius ITEM 5010]